MISVANPIYDTVFKYLMEDMRIAKTILSALLKKEVVEVDVRKHEYSNGTRDKISMFRIDFGARVRQDDGSLKLILIELQKTWLETETLRFRQYLGTQYSDPANIEDTTSLFGYAVPMVTVYILGHRVGDIEEPVLYVNHKSYNYDGQEVTKGMPNPFVDSLVHDSIIVQIPLLHGIMNNRLDKILSIFDQSHKDRSNKQLINIDDSVYSDDEEMKRIIQRLLSAAADCHLRQDMNVEDEYFSAIENRDTEIMIRDQKIAERDTKIAEQDTKIAEQDTKIAEQDTKIAEQDTKIAEQDTKIAEQDTKIAEQKLALQKSVQALKQAGFTLQQISAMTGLSVDDIEKI